MVADILFQFIQKVGNKRRTSSVLFVAFVILSGKEGTVTLMDAHSGPAKLETINLNPTTIPDNTLLLQDLYAS